MRLAYSTLIALTLPKLNRCLDQAALALTEYLSTPSPTSCLAGAEALAQWLKRQVCVRCKACLA